MTLADKIIPCLYVIEVEGTAVSSIFPGDFGIEKISIGSKDFSNDMFATAALADAMSFIVLNPKVDTSDAHESVEYNPEFFPSLKKVTTVNSDEEINEDEVTPTSGLTHLFDPLGDFVESRWTIESSTFKVQGKVIVNPDRYMLAKLQEVNDKMGPPQLKHEIKSVVMH